MYRVLSKIYTAFSGYTMTPSADCENKVLTNTHTHTNTHKHTYTHTHTHVGPPMEVGPDLLKPPL